jgi:PEP-CTERM motif
MKKAILYASIVSVLTAVANAQNDVNWQTPITISAPTDVNTQGTYFGSWAPHGSGNFTINGVTFQNFSDLPSLANNFQNNTGDNTFHNPGTSDANYNDYMTSGAFQNDSSSPSFSWGGMTIGDTYLVELWVNDARNSTTAQRTESVTGGANTSAFLSYGPVGGAGQFIIGTFVANTATESLSLNSGPNFPSAQLNLFQVRDLGVLAVPEPSTLAILAAGVGAMFFGLRRKIRAA